MSERDKVTGEASSELNGPGEEVQRVQIMQKLVGMQPGDEISTKELELLCEGGAVTKVEGTGEGAETFAALQSEVVTGGRVAMAGLHIRPNPGEIPVGESVSFTMDLSGLGKPSLLLVQRVDELADVFASYSTRDIQAVLKRDHGIEANEEVVLAAMQKKWPEHTGELDEARLLHDVFEQLQDDFEPIFGPPDKCTDSPAEIVEFTKRLTGIEVSEEAVQAALRKRFGGSAEEEG